MHPQPLKDRCRGKWRSMLPQLGVPVKFLNGRHQPCPMCGGKDRARFDDREGRGTFFCSQCGAGDGFDLVMRINGFEFAEAAKRIEAVVEGAKPGAIKTGPAPETIREMLNSLWRASGSIRQGDPVALYLASRGLRLPTYPKSLRAAPWALYSQQPPMRFPAMVAMVSDVSGKPHTLHRTFLTKEGAKAPVDDPRRLMPGTIEKGCAVRLAEHGDVLGIAEGIETALSATQLTGIPCWAAVNSTMLAAWVPPEGVKQVVVFGDCDAKFGGQAAAYALAHRIAKPGVAVEVRIPEKIGTDWNDILVAGQKKYVFEVDTAMIA